MKTDLLQYICRLSLKPTILLTCLILLCPAKSSAEDIFRDLTDNKNVESTYVSGRMSNKMTTWKGASRRSTVNLDNGFSSLYSYRCYSVDAVNEARKILNAYLKRNKEMELVMRSKELGGEYMVYEQFDASGGILKMLIWNSTDVQDCEIVVIEFPTSTQSGGPRMTYKATPSPDINTSAARQSGKAANNRDVYIDAGELINLKDYTLEGDWSQYGIR